MIQNISNNNNNKWIYKVNNLDNFKNEEINYNKVDDYKNNNNNKNK